MIVKFSNFEKFGLPIKIRLYAGFVLLFLFGNLFGVIDFENSYQITGEILEMDGNVIITAIQFIF